MRPNCLKAALRATILLSVACLLAAGTLFAQDIYLSAKRTTKAMPDGKIVPMWGFASCIVPDGGSPSNGATWSCPEASVPGPDLSRVGTGPMNIYVYNQLPTAVSLMVPGQLAGGGIGSPEMAGDRVRSLVPETAPAQTRLYSWTSVRTGTYLYESGTRPSVQVPMGLYGAITIKAAEKQAYPAADTVFDAEKVVLFSEVDAVQNAAVDLAGNNVGAYPGTIGYNPKYFLINGLAFQNTSPGASTVDLGTPVPGSSQYSIVLHLVNAGLQSHTAMPVGLQLTLLAEDGNVYPDRKRQADVLLGAGKAIDTKISLLPKADGTFDATYPLFDRMLDLSSGDSASGGPLPDSGMLAYLKIGAGSIAPPVAVGPTAVNDVATVGKNNTLTCANAVPDPCNVMSNDSGVTSVQLVANPRNGAVTLNSDGTFTYTPNAHFAGVDTFSYKGASSNVAAVTITVGFSNEAPVANADGPYTNNIGTTITVAKPGVLGNDTDFDGDPLTMVVEGTPPGGLAWNPDGSFSYTGPSTSFSYRAKDSQGLVSDPIEVQLVVNQVSNLALTVKDPSGATIADYRWIVEEDRTWQHDSFNANGPSLGTNFHASYMPVVAQGCLGSSCAEQVPIGEVVLDPLKRYYVSVLPNDAGNGAGDESTAAGHTVGGASLKPGEHSITVLVNPQPIKTAQISVFIFEDNFPTNGAPDGDETGLARFQITVIDAGGRYGQNGGQMSFDAFGNPLKNVLPCAPFQPDGIILTCNDGTALIQNLAPGKYTILADPPANSNVKWVQTATIEGTRGIDAWVKSGEPSYFQEFGPPGYHVFIGFVSPSRTPTLRGANTVKGQVTNLHMSRPPDQTLYDSGSRDALGFTTCWVGLNSGNGVGENVSVQQCDADGNFTLSRIPNGSYELVVWDQWLDQIIASRTLNIPGTPDLTSLKVPVFSWFTRVETNIFVDTNEDGVWQQETEGPLPDAPIALRFRDGSFYQGSTMDFSGYYSFDETFPFFNWIVVDADPMNYKSTGANITVDAGGPVDEGGVLNPQAQADGTSIRMEGPGVRTQALQGFVGQTAVLNFGRKAFEPGENGGITGMISYASTRSEDDVRMAAINEWEPAIPDVTLRLYRKVETSNGGTGLVFVKETKSTSWDRNLPTGCPGQLSSDPFFSQTLQAAGYGLDHCYDGMHAFNQVRPGVYDGRYTFTGVPAGTYVVEVVPPPGYELVKEEDKNVFTGDAYIAPVGIVTPVYGVVDVMPSQSLVGAENAPSPGVANPPCVGEVRTVPEFLSLFPQSEAPFAGMDRALCNRKEVTLTDRSQGLADFHLFTSTPIASHFTGMILDDLSQEFNQAAPNFGEKFSPPFVPVSIRNFNGVEIGRTYSDQWGMFNGLLPSTYNANVPLPSGYSPAMLITCMNDPGPITLSDGSKVQDPHYNPMYSNFCYTMQYMPGTTTYLDTPVLPVAAFASGYNPVDCAQPVGTPGVKQVDGDGVGPYVSPSGSRTLTITSLGTVPVPNPAYEGPAAPAPYNQKTIARDFGFGATAGTVKLGGITLTISSWDNDRIVATLPASATTGQLVVTRGDNGKSTVNSITVTVETASPLRVTQGQSIQAAIDSAAPGSLIIIGPGTFEELVIMWKPVRLQGAGTGSTVINAAKFPTEKIENWRARILSLFNAGTIDLLPGQNGVDGAPIIGPGILGDEEGAGVTVIAKNDPSIGSPGPNSFRFHASGIDGLTITGGDSGGGVFVNGYAHGLQISNNSIYGNSGFYHGGLRVGHPFLLNLTGNGPFAFNTNINIHHNSITTNGSVTEGAAGGGVSLCTGTDNYHVNYNFICGNFSNGHGGGVGHFGLSNGGEMLNNQIIFNQSFSQGTNQSGGGIFIGGETPVGGGLTLGAGNVTLDSNLIQGNHAGAGHGGGIRLQQVNGQDVQRSGSNPNNWWKVSVVNNMIVNNVAGWSGGGISLQDTANSTVSNNTITNNDSTATVGVTFTAGPNTSAKQPGGISSERHSLALADVFGNGSAAAPYRVFSNPLLSNNIVWHNRSFNYATAGGTAGLVPALNNVGGACDSNAYYWDLGVLGDTTPTPNSTVHLNPTFSILTNISGYAASNRAVDPSHVGSYCNGPRTLRLVAGITTLLPLPALDEGGNWIDVRWGPLTLGGDYHLQAASLAKDTGTQGVTSHDFDGQGRPLGCLFDVGADELPGASCAPQATVSPNPVAFGNQRVLVLLPLPPTQTLTLTNTGAGQLLVSSISVSGPFMRPLLTPGSCGSSPTLSAGASCTIIVRFLPTASGPATGAVTINSNDPAQSSLAVPLTGTGYQIDLNTNSLSFSYTPATSRTRTITVRNWGTSPIAMGTPTIGGANPGNFAVTGNNCGSSLAAALVPGILARTCTITVQFTSATNTPPGGLNATLNVNASDPGAPQLVTLNGTRP